MQYANVGGERVEATPGIKATCPLCKTGVVAKCGQLVVHHWAHVSNQECDPWWEPETAWHRRWKSFARQTEVTIQNHRADIVTSTGLIVELQHSGIAVEEIQERERCYGPNLRWLFDGTNIPVSAPNREHLCYPLPPDTDDFVTVPGDYGHNLLRWEGKFWTPRGLTTRLNLQCKQPATNRSWGVVTFRWLHPRKHYASPARPVYIDLPGHFILKLGHMYIEDGVPCRGWGHLVPRATVEGWLR